MKKFIICAIYASFAQYTLDELCELVRYLSKRPIRRSILKGTYSRLFRILLKKFNEAESISNNYQHELRLEMQELSKIFIPGEGGYFVGYALDYKYSR